MASGEDSLIAKYLRPLATDAGAFGLSDDAAILKSFGDDLVVTTDAIVEGVHYLADDPPETIARKALRVNLSDLAAKGATPAGFLLTLALRETKDSWLAPFVQALGDDAQSFKCPLLGGDTVSTPGPAMISITAFGRVPPGKMVHRRGAKSGDRVVVTGTIGDASAGLVILKGADTKGMEIEHRDVLIARYRVPQPRVALLEAIRDHASAAMDVSDGFAGDLAKLCAASGVSAAIDARSVPVSEAATAALAVGITNLENLLGGGDDYEVLCTVPENRWEPFEKAATLAGVPVASVGQVVKGPSAPLLIGPNGQPLTLKRHSYSHF